MKARLTALLIALLPLLSGCIKMARIIAVIHAIGKGAAGWIEGIRPGIGQHLEAVPPGMLAFGVEGIALSGD